MTSPHSRSITKQSLASIPSDSENLRPFACIPPSNNAFQLAVEQKSTTFIPIIRPSPARMVFAPSGAKTMDSAHVNRFLSDKNPITQRVDPES